MIVHTSPLLLIHSHNCFICAYVCRVFITNLLTEAIEQANPEQRKQLADKMRQEVQMATAGQMNAAAFNNLDDDRLIEIMK